MAIVEIVKFFTKEYPDSTTDKHRRDFVVIKAICTVKKQITFTHVYAHAELQDMVCKSNTRLSVQPRMEKECNII